MKKWTVMLIPHGRGERQSFNLSILLVWACAIAFVGLAFCTGYFYKAGQLAQGRSADFEERYRQVERRMDARLGAGISSETLEALESEERARYEARIETIAAELSRVYDLEAEVRQITGLPPRDDAVSVLDDPSGGKGGRPMGLGGSAAPLDEARMRPPEIIYGLSRPSADLIFEELRLRGESLGQLIRAMEAQLERIARTPSIWPAVHSDRWISSRFGRRKDPFTKRMRHHDGLDISTKRGTPVVATARGTVVFAGRERYMGNLIKIDHDNGVETWYAHLNHNSVEVGDHVERGDEIGQVGSTGRSTGPHVHYEIQIGGKPVNPRKYLGL